MIVFDLKLARCSSYNRLSYLHDHATAGSRSTSKIYYPDTLLRLLYPEGRGSSTLQNSGNYFPFNMA